MGKVFSQFRRLFDWSCWVYVEQIILRTRSYDEGLEFTERMEAYLEAYQGHLTQREYMQIDQQLIRLKLTLLDKADRWHAYVDLWDKLYKEKQYLLTYDRSRDDPDFNRFVVKEDRYYKYVHFLYVGSHRYDLIKKKIQKLSEGKKVGNLMHRTQAELTDEEIEERYNFIMELALKNSG